MTKKKYKKPILVPGAESKMNELRYEITKAKGWLDVSTEDWWGILSPMQRSIVNGEVTKMMVVKAQRDMMQAYNQNIKNMNNQEQSVK